MLALLDAGPGFGTIRNNTALKHQYRAFQREVGFGTIRNNTALKLRIFKECFRSGFGTIRNNTALKQFPQRFL